MAYHVSQERMEELALNELNTRGEKGGEICSMLTLEFVSCDVEAGELVLKHIVPPAAANPSGNLHGGIIAWLLDSTMGMLSRSYTGYEVTVTMDIHVNFLRAIRIGDEMILKGHITHSGKQIVNVCAEAYVNGRKCATADSIFYRIEK